MPTLKTKADIDLLALANALREAVTGKSPQRRIAAARRIMAALRTVPPRRAPTKRGRKAEHDKQWATDQVLEIVLRGGFPEKRTDLVDLLRDRFIACPEKGEPENTWLWAIVRGAYDMAASNELDWRLAYRNNPALEQIYFSEEEYLSHQQLRHQYVTEWRASSLIQTQYKTAESYVNTMLSARLRPSELANNSEILPQSILK